MTHFCLTRQPTPAIDLRPARLLIWLLLMCFSALTMADSGHSDTTPPPTTRGTLVLHGIRTVESIPAMRLGTDMDVTVTGPIARVRVTQAFRNTSAHWMAGRYLYPLPDDGAVDSLKMVVGQRVILGHIQRRAEARAIYERAAAAGRKAGLVEQQRPNLFANSVANVGPGETVLIAIEYQAPVRQVDGVYSLRLPLVAAPRYVSAQALQSPEAVADANTVTSAPILDPGLDETINPVTITVHLDPGFTPADITSRYHPIDIEGDGGARTIRLASSSVAADRDFALEWRSASAEPTVGVFSQQLDGEHYVMATITPPAVQTDVAVPPREMIFVIDNSGSMGGASMRQAKASLRHALSTLRAGDRFNIIRFDDTTTQLFAHSMLASDDQLAIARRFTQGLEASGGTEMLPALEKALADDGSDESAVRQVIFLTDGAITNEKQMLATLARDGGRSRVFPVGIGSAPNDYLMSRMARIGRGTYTHVGSTAEVEAQMTQLLDTLRRPTVRNLSIRASDDTLELTPARLPDLYAGEPLVILGRSRTLDGTLTIDGFIGDRHWSKTVALTDAKPSPAVAKGWARGRIRDVETERTLGQLDDTTAYAQIARIGLRHTLVTSQTSLVAVDVTPRRPTDAPLTRAELPINLPAGWDFDTLLHGHHVPPDSAAAPVASEYLPTQANALDLPQTATDFVATMAWGTALLGLGLAGLIALRRRGGTL